MTTIALWSDLHLEFYDDAPTWKNPGADVLVLSGDICVAEDLRRNPSVTIEQEATMQKDWRGFAARRFRQFFSHVNKEFDHVLYVMGNHEHYDGVFGNTADVLRQELANYSNITLMDETKVVVDDVVFLGSSMWTDFNNADPLTMITCKDFMSDYKYIRKLKNGSYSRLRPEDTLHKHRYSLGWLRLMLQEDKRKTVVVGHHAPSWQSIHPKFASQSLMNGAFVSNLDDFILDHEHIALWTCGHVHHPHRYYVGETLVSANPRGYPGELSSFDPTRVIDLDNLPTADSLTQEKW